MDSMIGSLNEITSEGSSILDCFNSAQETSLQETREQFVGKFPVSVFPTHIQDFIREHFELLNFHPDFLSSSILFATSVALGNTVEVEVTHGWTEKAIVYILIAAPSGSGKTHPPYRATREIAKADE